MAESGKVFSRSNTLEEKRRMRAKRKKMKRSRVKFLQSKIESEQLLRAEATKKVALYRNMSRSYWERWRWELQKRKEEMSKKKVLLNGTNVKTRRVLQVNEIHPSCLSNLPGSAETFIGRGSFGVVKVQLYRSFEVAVKEFLPHSLLCDVLREGRVLSMLCHPYLPLFFGATTSVRPFRLVMQYHYFNGDSKSITLDYVIRHSLDVITEKLMTVFCVQLMEAVHYLHETVSLLHNDLKCNNILVCNEMCSNHGHGYQIVVIDFGKATSVDSGRTFSHSTHEKTEHYCKYSHISPEVIEGITSQTKMSDIFPSGCVIKCICRRSTMKHPGMKLALNAVVERCCSTDFESRPAANEVQNLLKEILEL